MSGPPTPATSETGNHARDRRGDMLAYASLGLLAIVIILLFFKGVPEGAAGTLLVTLATGVLSIVATVFGFQFGSSQGSQDKNAQLAALRAPPIPPLPIAPSPTLSDPPSISP